MRLPGAFVAGLGYAAMVAAPVLAATDAPPAQDGLPIALVIAVVAGLLAFAYFFMRPSRISGRKD